MFEFNASHLQMLVQGAGWTVLISAIALLGGGLLGLLTALSRVSPVKPVKWAAMLYVQLIQGTPLLILMFLFFFGLSLAGYEISAIIAVSLALSIYVGAYLGEIWRGCIEAIPKTQWEAAECLALSKSQRMRQVILPQALKIATPPTVGFMVQVVKNSSLASVVGFVELARAGQMVNNTIFQPFIVYVFVALFYFVICFPLSQMSRRLERKLNVGHR
jgi:polar amino acid transport system permease protein